MIRKTAKGYKIVSEKGRNLSKPNLSLAAAKRRLARVEYFKHVEKHLRKLP